MKGTTTSLKICGCVIWTKYEPSVVFGKQPF